MFSAQKIVFGSLLKGYKIFFVFRHFSPFLYPLRRDPNHPCACQQQNTPYKCGLGVIHPAKNNLQYPPTHSLGPGGDWWWSSVVGDGWFWPWIELWGELTTKNGQLRWHWGRRQCASRERQAASNGEGLMGGRASVRVLNSYVDNVFFYEMLDGSLLKG